MLYTLVISKRLDGPVPVPLGVLVERRKHDWQYDVHVVCHQITEILVVPKVECTLRNLYVD